MLLFFHENISLKNELYACKVFKSLVYNLRLWSHKALYLSIVAL